MVKLKNPDAEFIDFEEFMASTLTPVKTQQQAKEKSADEIITELMPFVEADKRKGG